MPAPDEKGFDEPWQIQAFALTHALADAGHFTWGQWAETLSRHLHAPEARADGADYYERWVAALEELLTARGVADDAAVTELTALWQAAARATPHGHPIDLANAQRD